MIDVYMKNKIIILHRQGFKIREIERELNISRNTVRKYTREYDDLIKQIDEATSSEEKIRLTNLLVSAPKRKSATKKRKFVGDIVKRFYEIIEENKVKDSILGDNKQTLTGTLLHKTLVSEGYDIGETTIRSEFAKYKDELKKEAFITQYYKPGIRAEYDFHLIKVLINGKKRNVYQATISLPHSNYKFARYYLNQRSENFIDSLIEFFEEIGGVPEIIVFDNMRNVVANFLYGGGKLYNEELIKLSNYYGFEIQTTNPRKGNEKGHVEKSGQVIRSDLFTLTYKFNSLDEINEYAKQELIKLNDEALDKFNDEKNNFLKLPISRYDLGVITTSKVNKESLISIQGNFYSVPDKYVGKTVNTSVYPNLIKVFDNKHHLIAEHNKKVGKGEYSINILHFTTTFTKKPGALLNSVALMQAPEVMQTLFHKYFTTKPKEFIEIIKDNDIYELRDILISLDNGIDFNNLNTEETIEDISINQLNYISLLFDQGEKTQWLK